MLSRLWRSFARSVTAPSKTGKILSNTDYKDFLTKDLTTRKGPEVLNDLEAKLVEHIKKSKENQPTEKPSFIEPYHVKTFYRAIFDRLGPNYLNNFINVISNELKAVHRDPVKTARAVIHLLHKDQVLVNLFLSLDLNTFTPENPSKIIRDATLNIPGKPSWLPKTDFTFNKFDKFAATGISPELEATLRGEDAKVLELPEDLNLGDPRPAYYKPMKFSQGRIRSLRYLSNLVYMQFDETQEEELGFDFIKDFLKEIDVKGVTQIYIRPKYHRIEDMHDDKDWEEDDPDMINMSVTPVFAYLMFDGPINKAKAIEPSFRAFGSFFRERWVKLVDADLHRKVYVMNFADPFLPRDFLDYINPMQAMIANDFGVPLNPFSCNPLYFGFQSDIDYCILNTSSFIEAVNLRTRINYASFNGLPLLAELEAAGPELEFIS
jgi:hypothetical protein